MTEAENLVERVKQITGGRGARLVFNAITGPILNDLAAVTADGGLIIQYGAIGHEETPLPSGAMNRHGLSIRGYTLYELTYHAENLPAIRQYVSDGVRQGCFNPVIDRAFRFDEMVDVHRYLEAGSRLGSVVVLV